MASDVLCGRCGAVLDHPSAVCRSCGSRAAEPRWARPRKSPALAAMLAVVPGLGHLYLGHHRKGLAFMAGTGLLQFVGFDFDLSVIGAVIGVPMELGGAGLWLYSIYDAYQTASKMK